MSASAYVHAPSRLQPVATTRGGWFTRLRSPVARSLAVLVVVCSASFAGVVLTGWALYAAALVVLTPTLWSMCAAPTALRQRVRHAHAGLPALEPEIPDAARLGLGTRLRDPVFDPLAQRPRRVPGRTG